MHTGIYLCHISCCSFTCLVIVVVLVVVVVVVAGFKVQLDTFYVTVEMNFPANHFTGAKT